MIVAAKVKRIQVPIFRNQVLISLTACAFSGVALYAEQNGVRKSNASEYRLLTLLPGFA